MNRKILGTGAVILAGAVIGGVLVGVWVFRNIDARLLLTNQSATVLVPQPVKISADILNNLDIEINDSLKTTVPVDQIISIPIKDTLHVIASFDSNVPIKLTVPVHDKIVIDQVLDVDTTIKANLLGDTHDLPIRGKIPVKATVPVNLVIPIDQPVHLKFTAPVDVKFTQPLVVPLKADIAATIPIHSEMSVPVKSALDAEVTIPQPANVIITHANLRLPLRTLKLGTKDGKDEGSAGATAAAPESTPGSATAPVVSEPAQ
ncbi:MAG TPA: hypothetical protein VN046_01385 [Stenotrophobium sp.]|jgi:hypothetical protein|nr:hypothetical protein [Stenotrophobium sp.]